MPGLFSDYALKDARLRNRIAISPMTQYSCGTDGIMTDWHMVHLGARAVGGAGLVIAEQLAVAPEGRMTPGCAGIWTDDQMPALRRITDFHQVHRCRARRAARPFRPQGQHPRAVGGL